MAKDIIPGGLADNKPDSDFDPKALKEGIKVEMEHTSDPDIAKEISKDHISESPAYYSALKVMERKLEGRKFKKSALIKGVKQRLFPVGQEQKEHKALFGKPLTDRLEGWQRLNQPEQRTALANQIGQLPPNTMKRAVIDLSKKTATRRNKDTGELEFLMHRGVGNAERENAIDIPSRQTMHASHTSWTPVLEQAQEFAALRNKANSPSGLLSAWIPQSAIATVLKHWGSYSAEDRGFPGGQNEYAKEHEVIVHPGNYELVHDRDVKKLIGRGKRDLDPKVYSVDQAINFRANPGSEKLNIARVYGREKSKRDFKKSSLVKGAMRRLAPWSKESRQTSSGVQDNLADWQENVNPDSRKYLANTKIDRSSKKRTLHKLSGLTPTRIGKDGKREFLLHRGMGLHEFQYNREKIDGKPHYIHHAETSWTPNLTVSGGFASDAGRDLPDREGAHVSAWVHEDNIALMPNQFTNDKTKTQGDYKYEQEVIVKPGGKSPLVHKDDVAKLTGVDKDDRYTHPGGKILDNPDRMINFRQQNQTQFGGDPIQRNKHILPEFKRMRFKKSQLAKGVAQRLFPFNPENDLSEMDEESIARWQKLDPSTSEYEPGQPEISTKDQHKQLREDVPSFSGPAKNRSLLKLHGKTQSRRNPNTGDVEYLLHRGYGKGGEESLWHKHDDKQSDIPQRTSWTPHKEIAENFSRQHRGQTVSAWIPQNKIVNVPKQYGIVSVFPEQDRKVRSENRYSHEHEVIVEPGTYQHGTGPQASIDVEISRRGLQGETYPHQIRGYAEARGRFKKSLLKR